MADNKLYANYEKMAKEIFTLVDKGKTREEVAAQFNYENIRSMDQLMRRRGYKVLNNKYVKDDRSNEICFIPVRVERIMAELNKAEKENIEISGAQLHRWGFETRQQLNSYMRREGVNYDPINKQYYALPCGAVAGSQNVSPQSKNYSGKSVSAATSGDISGSQISPQSGSYSGKTVLNEKPLVEYQSETQELDTASPSVQELGASEPDNLSTDTALEEADSATEKPDTFKDISEFIPFLQFLYDNRKIFDEIVNEKTQLKPKTVTIPGKCVQKTFHLNRNLACLINEFADEFGLKNKQIIEAAIVEYFERYGYFNKVELIKHRG